MFETIKKFFMNVMTSGRSSQTSDEARLDTIVRYILLNSLIFIGGSFLFGFAFQNLVAGQMAQSYADFAMGMMAVIAFFVLRSNVPFTVSGLLTVVPFMMLCAFFTWSGGAQGSGVLWSYSFPMMAIFLLGMKNGTVLSLVLFVIVCLAVFVPGFSARTYPLQFAFRASGVYLLVLACTLVYEQTKVAKDRWVAKLTRQLKAERDEIAAMKDNLNVGLFLINTDYQIQPQYSHALEKILEASELQGRNFLDLLANSIQQKERETLMDYFTMVFNRSYDAQMLEDINPLHQFTYLSTAGGEQKTLRCTFAPVTRDNGEVFVLGTISDQTFEVALQKQLNEEEGKRTEEMRSLFEVIHVEPRVLHDFIEDAEYEFDRINVILKDNERSAQTVMVDIYQSVHAIKSNAVILGLDSFSSKLHALEDEIKTLREKADISFEEVLHITVELDKLMRIKDSFKDLIDKILSFNIGENRMKEEQVLVQTLERVIEKASSDLGKKAVLSVKIDPRAIENGPRRVIKEILMQLVRNAVYHGIEYPEGRLSCGKTEEGKIKLSIEMQNEKIIISLTDDGRGLDFKAIRAKAVEMQLLAASGEPEDKNALTQILFMPGFSTATGADMYAGRGIGLNLVRERIKEVKGSIKLQTEEGKGTLFRISIPVELSMVSGSRIA